MFSWLKKKVPDVGPGPKSENKLKAPIIEKGAAAEIVAASAGASPDRDPLASQGAKPGPEADAGRPLNGAGSANGAVASAAPAEAGAPAAAASSQELAAANRFAAALGQLVSMAMASKPHQSMTLDELRRRVVPAVRNGQIGVASRRNGSTGVPTPVTALLWASVSSEVDQRLSLADGSALSLEAEEWTSGPNVWLIDVIGDRANVPQLLRQLGETQWKGRKVKMLVRDASGARAVREVGPA